MEKYDGIDPKEINTGSSLKYDLKFDSLDLLEIAMVFEEKCNIYIQDTSRLEKASSLGEFCYLLYKQTNPETQAATEAKEDIVKTQQTNFLQRIKQRFARQK
jgi:acyl carrier protein